MRLRLVSLVLAAGFALAAPHVAHADTFTLNLEANTNYPLAAPTSGDFGTVTLSVVNDQVQVTVSVAAGVPLEDFAFLFNGLSVVNISNATPAGLAPAGAYMNEYFGNYNDSVVYDSSDNLTSFQFDLPTVDSTSMIENLSTGEHLDAYFDLVTDDFTAGTVYEIASTEQAATVPEPSALWLLLGGLPLLAWMRRRAVF